ncbi:hypothetical protein L226DRAFT_147936 [Lentinus tigrinus ALCF2SS1-7]|uniref:uncharacterized protein n=1 Tax=Lentinus tigrinus ALCF2SS1-7 TaxID=1328758 RepID=UPI00116628C6|nr:hypothetical protein L226DRAFT_147936 [Lentinus tigrinus ALCF2SS1-7]
MHHGPPGSRPLLICIISPAHLSNHLVVVLVHRSRTLLKVFRCFTVISLSQITIVSVPILLYAKLKHETWQS